MLSNFLSRTAVYGLFVLACSLVLTACGSANLKTEILPTSEIEESEAEEQSQGSALELSWYLGLYHETSSSDSYLELQMTEDNFIEPRKNASFTDSMTVRIEFSEPVSEESIDVLVEGQTETEYFTFEDEDFELSLNDSRTELRIHFVNSLSDRRRYRVNLLNLETSDDAPKNYSQAFSIVRGDVNGNGATNDEDRQYIENLIADGSLEVSPGDQEAIRADIFNINGYGGLVDSHDASLAHNFDGNEIVSVPLPEAPLN